MIEYASKLSRCDRIYNDNFYDDVTHTRKIQRFCYCFCVHRNKSRQKIGATRIMTQKMRIGHKMCLWDLVDVRKLQGSKDARKATKLTINGKKQNLKLVITYYNFPTERVSLQLSTDHLYETGIVKSIDVVTSGFDTPPKGQHHLRSNFISSFMS